MNVYNIFKKLKLKYYMHLFLELKAPVVHLNQSVDVNSKSGFTELVVDVPAFSLSILTLNRSDQYLPAYVILGIDIDFEPKHFYKIFTPQMDSNAETWQKTNDTSEFDGFCPRTFEYTVAVEQECNKTDYFGCSSALDFYPFNIMLKPEVHYRNITFVSLESLRSSVLNISDNEVMRALLIPHGPLVEIKWQNTANVSRQLHVGILTVTDVLGDCMQMIEDTCESGDCSDVSQMQQQIYDAFNISDYGDDVVNGSVRRDNSLHIHYSATTLSCVYWNQSLSRWDNRGCQVWQHTDTCMCTTHHRAQPLIMAN